MALSFAMVYVKFDQNSAQIRDSALLHKGRVYFYICRKIRVHLGCICVTFYAGYRHSITIDQYHILHRIVLYYYILLCMSWFFALICWKCKCLLLAHIFEDFGGHSCRKLSIEIIFRNNTCFSLRLVHVCC